MKLDRKPAVIGHSFGGLLAQILAGRGLSAATVVIDPAPSPGVLPLPVSALKASAAVLTNPANRGARWR
jgi:non-heme chloroperoxidase